MKIFDDEEFIKFLQRKLDDNPDTFTPEERLIDWKLGVHLDSSGLGAPCTTVREWAERWGCSTGTAWKTIKEGREIVGERLNKAQKVADNRSVRDDLKTPKVNSELNAELNTETHQTHVKSAISSEGVNAELNSELNNNARDDEKDIYNTHAHAPARAVNELFISNNTTRYARSADAQEFPLVGEGDDAFSLRDIEGKLKAHLVQRAPFKAAFDASGLSLRDLAMDIYNHYGLTGAMTASGKPVTKKNLFHAIANGWINHKMKRIRAGENPRTVFGTPKQTKPHGKTNQGDLGDRFDAAFTQM